MQVNATFCCRVERETDDCEKAQHQIKLLSLFRRHRSPYEPCSITVFGLAATPTRNAKVFSHRCMQCRNLKMQGRPRSFGHMRSGSPLVSMMHGMSACLRRTPLHQDLPWAAPLSVWLMRQIYMESLYGLSHWFMFSKPVITYLPMAASAGGGSSCAISNADLAIDPTWYIKEQPLGKAPLAMSLPRTKTSIPRLSHLTIGIACAPTHHCKTWRRWL